MNNRLFGLHDISEARNFIYGIAIVWIVFFHSGLCPATELFSVIKSYGDCGVEIFFLLSGICLFYSYDKDKNTLAFYKRRVTKIFPPYLIVFGIVFIGLDIISTFNVSRFLLDYTLLDFWLHGLGRVPWFVAAIIVFYFSYPLIYNILFVENKNKTWKILSFFSFIIIAIVILVKYCPHLNVFTVRIPIFIIGCLLGKLVHKDCDVKRWQVMLLALLIAGACILFLLYANIWWLRFLFYFLISIALVLMLSQIYKLLDRFVPILNKPFLFLGKLTLEIYLCHETIQESFIHLLRWCGVSVDYFDSWYQWLCIALAIGTAFVVNIIVKVLFRRFNKAFKKK